jgi:hypothetical protein
MSRGEWHLLFCFSRSKDLEAAAAFSPLGVVDASALASYPCSLSAELLIVPDFSAPPYDLIVASQPPGPGPNSRTRFIGAPSAFKPG